MFKSKMGHFQTGVLEYNKAKGEKKRVWSLCVCVFAQSHETFPRMLRAEKDKVNNINTVRLTSAQADILPFFPPPPPLLHPRLPLSLCYFSLPPLSPPRCLPHPQWDPTSAATAARRPLAVSSPTLASCPWPSPRTTPSPGRDSPPTTPSARGASPWATRTRVRSSRQGKGGERRQQTFLKRKRSCFSRYFYRTSDLAKSDSTFLESDSNTCRVYTMHDVLIRVSLKAKIE